MMRIPPVAAWLVPVVVGFGAIGAALTRQAIAVTREVLPTYGQVPEFQLIDHHGDPVSRQTPLGRVWVSDIIFTLCAGQCTHLTAQMALMANAVETVDAVTFVSVSVDPAWDTPDVLARYAAQVGAEGRPWVLLTGDPAQITRLCRDGFKLAFGEHDGTAEEPITHSSRLVLLDQTGMIRGYYEATDTQAMSRLQRDVRVLLKERS
jgi:protein SCO1/2